MVLLNHPVVFVPEVLEKTGEVLKETLGQWTGLKTEDGTEIYEGDVVRAGSMCESPHIGVVQFCPDLGGYIVWDERESGMGFNQLTIHEVIGNIYDDPKLKKKYWEIYSK